MAIPIKTIKQNCCDGDLRAFIIIDGDNVDQVNPTCDKIVECSDKYILVEEKSILLDFFNRCCKETGEDFEKYKYMDGDIQYLKMTELIILSHGIDIPSKQKILAEAVAELLMTSLVKVSNTTDILNKNFDDRKTSGMKVFYLYCNSGKPIDSIMDSWLSKYRKNIFIECKALIGKLQKECV